MCIVLYKHALFLFIYIWLNLCLYTVHYYKLCSKKSNPELCKILHAGRTHQCCIQHT